MATTDAAGPWIPVPPKATTMSVNITIGSAYSWGSDTVKLQWVPQEPAYDLDEIVRVESAVDFASALNFSSSATGRKHIAVQPGLVRLKPAVAGGSGDPDAIADIDFHA